MNSSKVIDRLGQLHQETLRAAAEQSARALELEHLARLLQKGDSEITSSPSGLMRLSLTPIKKRVGSIKRTFRKGGYICPDCKGVKFRKPDEYARHRRYEHPKKEER